MYCLGFETWNDELFELSFQRYCIPCPNTEAGLINKQFFHMLE